MHRRHCPVEAKEQGGEKSSPLIHRHEQEVPKSGARVAGRRTERRFVFLSAAEQSVVCLSVDCEVQRIT